MNVAAEASQLGSRRGSTFPNVFVRPAPPFKGSSLQADRSWREVFPIPLPSKEISKMVCLGQIAKSGEWRNRETDYLSDFLLPFEG